MDGPAWISILLFIVAVIFSIIMAAISPAFRKEWKLESVSALAIFFVVVVASGIILSISAQCSISGKYGKYTMCYPFAWTLAFMIFAVFATFMTFSIIAYIKEKNEKEKDKELSISSISRVTTES